MNAPRDVTASTVGLGISCLWWARHDANLPPQGSSRQADLGTEVHAAIRHKLDTGNDPERLSAEVRAFYLSWLVQWHQVVGRGSRLFDWRAEVKFAVDPFASKGRELTAKGERDYSEATPYEIPGTVDAICRDDADDDVIEITDWKTGFEAPDADGNSQLMTLALAATLAYGVSRARVSIVHVRPDAVRVDEVELDEFDLNEHRLALCRLQTERPTAQPKPGPHCRGGRCPALGACPATSGALVEIAPRKTRLPVVLDAAQIEGPEHAAELYEFARFAQAKLGYLWNALRTYTDNNGAVSLGDGRTWGPRTSRRETIDLGAPGALDALKSTLGKHVDLALDKSTTKTAIEAAARAVAADNKEPIVAVKRRALEALRAVGAIGESTTTKHEESKEKDKEQAA